MSRTFNELTPTEQMAFKVWQSKLTGSHTTKEEKEEAQRQVNKLLLETPLDEVRQKIKELENKVDALTAIVQSQAFQPKDSFGVPVSGGNVMSEEEFAKTFKEDDSETLMEVTLGVDGNILSARKTVGGEEVPVDLVQAQKEAAKIAKESLKHRERPPKKKRGRPRLPRDEYGNIIRKEKK